MASFDILSGLNYTIGAVQTLSGTTPNNSALIDMRGWEGLTVLVDTGTVTDAGTAAGFTMKLQHSNTTVTGDFVDVTAADLLPAGGTTTVTVTTDAANNLLAGAIGYTGNLRYVRAVFTGTSGTNATVQPVFVRGRPSSTSQPVTAIGATTAAT
jgi:hypothetical protein